MFVAFSEIAIDPNAAAELTAAFSERLGEVERWPGFGHLEVWQSERDAGRFVMVSWWTNQECFTAYMRSASHKRSHDRIPEEPDRPRAVAFSRFRVVAR